MHLTLEIQSVSNQAPVDTRRQRFDTFPVLLGRSGACDYNLEDISLYISSNHATISKNGEQLIITDTSSNGVFINGSSEPLGRNQSRVLTHADTVTIGHFILSATIEASAPPAPAPDDIDILFADFTDNRPNKASLLEEPTDEESIWAPFPESDQNWAPAVSTTSEEPLAVEWEREADSTLAVSIDSMAATDATGSHSYAPAEALKQMQNNSEQASWIPEPSQMPLSTLDKALESLSNSSTATESANESLRQADNDNLLASASSQEPSKHTSSNAQQTALTALLKGAKLNESDFIGVDETKVLEQSGRLLAQMTDTMMTLLHSRAELKNAIRSDVTIMSRQDNNPLKFSVNANDALGKLLSDDVEGYLSTDAAMQEAIEDLKQHQLAVVEGMKSAVHSLLLQFNPDILAKTLERTGGFSANIPITREAKLWEMFREQYDSIRQEAFSNFEDTYMTEFRKSYEKGAKDMDSHLDF